MYVRLKKSNNDEGKPEFRVPMIIPGATLMTVGLLWYGWSGEMKVHWIVPNIGSFLYCTGCILLFNSTTLYIIDSYGMYAASAISGISVLRSLAGFGFPLFAPYMFDAVGYGWGNTILALTTAVGGVAIAGTLWYFGESLRKRKPDIH
jgi:hypothetical protein